MPFFKKKSKPDAVLLGGEKTAKNMNGRALREDCEIANLRDSKSTQI